MKSEEKRKAAEGSKLRYEKYLEEAQKRREEEEKQARERDQTPIGEMRYIDLTHLINTKIREQATTGNLPFLNLSQKKTATKWAWFSVGLIIVGFVAYQMYWRTTDYSLHIDKEHLYVSRTINGDSKKYEVTSKPHGWKICLVEGSCGDLLFPLEARYNDNYKFVFLVDGKVYWVRNDMTDPREVRFVDGSWCHDNDDSEDPWMSFDSYWESNYRDNYR